MEAPFRDLHPGISEEERLSHSSWLTCRLQRTAWQWLCCTSIMTFSGIRNKIKLRLEPPPEGRDCGQPKKGCETRAGRPGTLRRVSSDLPVVHRHSDALRKSSCEGHTGDGQEAVDGRAARSRPSTTPSRSRSGSTRVRLELLIWMIRICVSDRISLSRNVCNCLNIDRGIQDHDLHVN